MSVTVTTSSSVDNKSLVYRFNARDDKSYDQESDKLVLLPSSNYLLSNLTIIRDKTTSTPDLSRAFQRVATQIIAKACDFLPVDEYEGITPTTSAFTGVRQTAKVCGVSILRAGASFEEPLRQAYSGPLSFGKILIQRDEETCLPALLYSKFPSDLAEQAVLILEPILATGGSICTAIDLIISKGVPEDRIIVANLITSRKAIEIVSSRYPKLRLVTAAIDEKLNAKCQLEPGVGDFGDRFYGTT
ncbi:PRTase-like protein, partial [Aureobasidium melanogenum]